MPPNPALTTPELAALNAGDADVPVYLSFMPETILATATVASTPSDPISSISVSSPSSGWLTAWSGVMARFKDGSGNLVATRRLITTTSSTVKVDLSAAADVGLIPLTTRSHAISSGDSVELVERYDLWNRKPFVNSSGTIYQDGDIIYIAQNANPVDIYNVTINGQPGDFLCNVANGGTQAITAAITQTAWIMNGSNLYSYLWSYPASFTGVSGISTPTLTATAPVGSHIIRCTITPSVGDVIVITRWIRVHSPADPPIFCNITQDKRTRQSRSVTVRLVKERVAQIPIKGYCVIWSDGTWGGQDVPTATKKFCGYVNPTSYKVVPGYHEATIQIQGIGDVLNTIEADGINFNYLNFTGWESLPADGQNIYQVMHWVAYWRVMNLLQRFNWTTFANVTSGVIISSVAKQILISEPRSSVMAMLKSLATRYEANVGSRSDGEIISQIHPSLLATRSGVITRATLDATIYSNCTVTYQQQQQTGMLRYEGATSNNLILDTVLISQSPSEAYPGQSANTTPESKKVFENQANANQRCGDREKMLNNPYPRVELDIPNNWDVFEMADMERVDVDIASQFSPTGQAFTLTCIPVEMDKTWIPGRRAKTKLILEGETDGQDGQTVVTPTPIATTPAIPAPSTTYGGTTITCGANSAVVSFDGDAALVTDGTNIRLVTGLKTGHIKSIPLSVTGLPTGGAIALVSPDPFGNWWKTHTGTAPAYCLANGGVYHIADIFNCGLSWTLYQALTNLDVNAFPAVMRVSHAVSGDVYVMYSAPLSGIGKEVARITSSGIAWSMDLSIYQFDPLSAAMDIDQHGADEMWVCLVGSLSTPTARVIQILNGIATIKNSFNWAFRDKLIPLFLQKPQLTPSGSPNKSTSTPTILISMTGNDDRPNMALSTDGFSTYTEIGPTPHLSPGRSMSSMIAADNPNIIISSVVPFSTYDSCTAPGSGCSTEQGLWISTTGGSGGWTQTNGSTQANSGVTCGYFPTRVNGQYQIYTGGTASMGYIASLTSPMLTRTPDWTLMGNILQVIPIS